jgi:hypothetical protein
MRQLRDAFTKNRRRPPTGSALGVIVDTLLPRDDDNNLLFVE